MENGIEYTRIDNAFDKIPDFEKAQKLSWKIKIEDLHVLLTQYQKDIVLYPKNMAQAVTEALCR